MRAPWHALALLLTCAAVMWVSPSVFATTVVPPSRPCVLVNDYKEIFVGRVISSQELGPAHVQVLRTYKGTVSGTVVVTLRNFPLSFASLHQGETYVFYSSGPDKDPSVGREVSFWATKLLSNASPEELKLLSQINQPPHTGVIFGTLERHLTALERAPLPNVKVVAARRRKVYSGTTDEKGYFEITGLPAGDYRIGADISEAFALEVGSTDEHVHVEPHGCVDADLEAVNNATISGRITLPPGLKVEGTKVLARSVTPAGSDLEGVADRNGRYEILGLSPGEYIVGINLGIDFPRAKAPFPSTYYPGTRSLDEAKRFVIQGPAHYSDVDIAVPATEEILTLRIQATFEDGRPAQGQLIGLSEPGYGERDGAYTDAQGMASLRVVRGTRYVVVDFGLKTRGCPAPVTVGPEDYPDFIHLVYTKDGCREAHNVEAAGMLRASVRSKFSQVPIAVSWSDGSPVYDANVTIMSSSHSVPFVALFRTAKDGRVDVPVPLDQEFKLDAGIICANTNRSSRTLLFNTQSGIRWRELDPHQKGTPAWNNLMTSASSIRLVLEGGPCKSGSEPQ
jgi:hypothetical protein